MALTEVYVDPSIAGDSGAGTIGDPFGDLKYAIEQTTFDTTNGTRVNIKAGTAEVLQERIDITMADTVTTVAWVPTITAPVVFQGYTATAGDGGRGAIETNGNSVFFDASADYVNWIDLDFNTTGVGARMFQLDNYGYFMRCSFLSGAGAGFWVVQGDNIFMDSCYVLHQSSDYALDIDASSWINNCYIESTISSATGLVRPGTLTTVQDSIIITKTGDGEAIDITGSGALIKNNSIYCKDGDGTGPGIGFLNDNYTYATIENNLVEGFAGTGGQGIATRTGTLQAIIRGNAVYNCTTAYDISSSVNLDDGLDTHYGDNEILTESPFVDAANGDFTPKDVGNVIEGALPNVIGGGFV